MKKVEKTLRLFCEQYRLEKGTVRMWLGMCMGAALILIPIRQLLAFVQMREEPVHILEGFLYGILDPQSSMLAVLGFLFLLSDAPFVNERTMQTVLRTSRKIWNSSSLLYILFQAMAYYLFLMIFSVCLVSRQGYWGDCWSIPLSQIAHQDTLMIFQFQVSFPFWSFMQLHTPPMACLLTLTGNILYAFVLGMILYTGNLGTKHSVGTWLAVLVHFTGYIARKEWNPQWSLQSYASPAENGSFLPLLLIAAMAIVISYYRVNQIDFHVMEKEL